MRFLLALLLTAAAASAETLENLKSQFPTHVAGPITDKSDPAVQQCWNKYHKQVMALTESNLSATVKRMQDQATHEFTDIEIRLRRDQERRVMTAANKHAEQQNVAWLKQKLIPYLKRLAQFQRGR